MNCKLLVILATLTLATAEETARRKHYEDPFSLIDRHLTHTLRQHYLWPWSQLLQAASTIDEEDNLEDPHLESNPKKFEIKLNVKRFAAEELRVRVKNRYIVVEGKHKENTAAIQGFVANQFIQQFVLPAGCKEDEVTAVLSEKGILSISAPRHELPPPPPEIEVPIQVLLPEPTTTQKAEVTTTKEPVKVETTVKPLETLDLEATTHAGKIRKKELKSPKPVKDNEVTKGIDENGLDYALLENGPVLN